MAADSWRRFVIASGTENYVQREDRLESVPADLTTMVGFFTGQGYLEQLPELRHDPTSDALRTQLSSWLNDRQRQDSDVAVIYYSGHGDSDAGFHYLKTADTLDDQYESTALPADFFIRALGGQPKIRQLLLILDTCYSGHGAFNVAEVAARMAASQNLSEPFEGVWVLAASRSREEAAQSAFAAAFVQAARDLQQTTGTGTRQPYVGMDTLVWRINSILKEQGFRQQASWTPATLSTGLPPFLPNPGYQSDAPAGVDLATRARLARRAKELSTHWEPKARGVAVATQAGWYFSGRSRVLQELAEWLANPAPDTRLRVITGGPGSGKSAVLGRLVLLCDPQSRPMVPLDDALPGTVPPEDAITAALLARAKTAIDLRRELSDRLGGVPDTEPFATIGSRRPPAVLLLDALDEANDTQEVIDDFIKPLQAASIIGAGPRLIVATRRPQLAALPADRVEIDLDDPGHFRAEDVADYVSSVLLAEDDPASPTPYRDHPDLARAVGTEVAAIAGQSFLIAQLAARTLANAPNVLTAEQVRADKHRWHDVGTAFDRDLARYGAQEGRVRDLLTPLAWAQGAGLPPELWPTLARALTGHCADDDISWVLSQAGAYIAEAVEKDRSVYRLYHQEFIVHLQGSRDAASTQQAITTSLLRSVPSSSPGNLRDWLAVPPYIRTHLSTHAAACGALDELVQDPSFLLAADPARLLPALATVTSTEARRSASAFESAQYLLAGRPPGQAVAQLDLAARVHNAGLLVDRISQLPYKRPWTIAWGHWARRDRHVLLGRHDEEVRAVTVAMLDGTPVAISGGQDGTVQMWDLRAGAARGGPLRGHTGGVTALAVGEIDGIPMMVSGGSDGTMRLWNLRTSTALGNPLPDHSFGITALTVREFDGALVALSGSSDGKVRLLDLETGTLRNQLSLGRFVAVIALAICEVDGTPMAVVSGSDGKMQIWDLHTGARGRIPSHRQTAWVTAFAVGQIDGIPIVVSGGLDGTMRLCNLPTGAARSAPMHGHTGRVTALAVGEVDGTPVTVSGGLDGTVRLWNLKTGAAPAKPLLDRTDEVTALAAGEGDGAPVAVSRGLDGAVQVWDMRTGAARGKPLSRRLSSYYYLDLFFRWYLEGILVFSMRKPSDTPIPVSIALGNIDGTAVALSSHDNKLRMWDLRTRAARGKPLRGHTGWVTALAVGEIDGTPVAVSGGLDGTVRTWDLRTGAARGKPLRSRNFGVIALAVRVVDGISVVVSGGLDGTVRIWDLRTGAARGEPLRAHTGWLTALAVGEIDGTPVAVSGGRDGTVRIWDLRTGAARGEPLRVHAGRLTALAMGEIDGTPVAVSGDDSGVISWWTLDRGERALASLDTPAGVKAITYAGRATWLAATKDGSLFSFHLTLASRHATNTHLPDGSR